jgi:hypothetical protein
VHRRKPFFYFTPGYPGASRAFAIRKLLIAAACDTGITVSQAGTCVGLVAELARSLFFGVAGNDVIARHSCLQP